MTKINAQPDAVNRKMPGYPSPSWARAAVLVGSLAAVGLASVPGVAHADQSVPCAPDGLVNAINHANSGDVLSLAQGCVYVLTRQDNQDPILGDNGLPVIAQKLTIKGNGATITRKQGAAKFRIFQVAHDTGDLTISDLTVDNGDTSGTGPKAGRGGGISNLGTLNVTNSTFSHNHASFGGGGIGNGIPKEDDPPTDPVTGNLTLSDSVFFDNDGGQIGGAIGNGATSTTNLTGCTISQNTASIEGGGVANQGTAILNKCTISGNSGSLGGGIVNGGQLFLTDSPVTSNHAIADNSSSCQFTGLGGGIYNAPEGGTVTLIRSPVTGNEAMAAKSGSGCNSINDTGLGGGILNAAFKGAFGTVRLTDSDVSSNSAASGGGIANVGPMTLTHSNVTGNNSTGNGGGILNLTDRGNNTPIAALTLIHSDVIDNQASSGGGIFNQTGNTVKVNQTTVVFNTPDQCSGVIDPACPSMLSAESKSQ